ncbi:RNA ligase family protein, partial [Rhodobacter maris]
GGCHARSPDSRNHPSRDWLKAFAAGIAPLLAEGERIVGENLYARHSVGYDALPAWFLGFAWIVDDEVQPWDLTLMRFEELGITPVPTLWRGPWRAGLFETIAAGLDLARQEGFVARVAGLSPKPRCSAGWANMSARAMCKAKRTGCRRRWCQTG